MFTITDSACERLVEMLAHTDDDVVVRVVFGFHGLSFQYSAVCPGDQTFDYQGRTVLVLDAHLTDALREKTLDVRRTPEGNILDLV